MACFRLAIIATTTRKGRVLKMADAISNFVEAVYAMYDAAWVLIHKYELSQESVFATYKLIVRYWYEDYEDDENE